MNDQILYSVRGGYGIATQLSAREALGEMQRLSDMGVASKILGRHGRTICDSQQARIEAFR